MATHKKYTRRGPRKAAVAEEHAPILYVHGIGKHPPEEDLKRDWDLALFGRDMGARTQMAYWADILHGKETAVRTKTVSADRNLNVKLLLESAGVSAESEDVQSLARGLMRAMGIDTPETRTKATWLPPFLRKPLARAFLEALVKDTAAYFFKPKIRKQIRQRLLNLIPPAGKPVIIVAHSQGTIITLEVLAELAKASTVKVIQLITIGSPLGIREVQDFLSCDLQVPRGVEAWNNFADVLDPVALDKGLGNDFEPHGFIVDKLVVNTELRRLKGFNPHSAAGYLSHPKVRDVACRAARIDAQARFLMARDVTANLAVEDRHPVLIEILEPGFQALGESPEEMKSRELTEEQGHPDLSTRIEQAARKIESIVGKSQVKDACVDQLRRFVAARLTPTELRQVALQHRELRVYAVWKSATKRKLLHRSTRVIQADAVRASYGAFGEGVTWAVLDTGARHDHPHFKTYSTIMAIWDCTKRGKPVAFPNDRDPDGHGSHVAGIIAGASADGVMQGIAPKTKLVVYKVLKDDGSGEDAWIIKALDHIALHNENYSENPILGVNLSLGGSYDPTVYGCGFTPICAELRRLWRSGVLVCVASGNEGQIQVKTPDGEVDLNSPMSIGDPANLEDCIAVGSVHADQPHLYGVSWFSSRGPTSDGRMKPDVVAPGERIRSCDSHCSTNSKANHYCEESGTSMATPHVSGLLAAFLSVRREFRGRPDEVKQILLRTCIDIGRDRYHQGHGIPNLMRMLLET